MRGLSYVISKKAVSNLEEIWLYPAEKSSLERADRYYHLIIDEINYISKHPFAGKSMEHVRKGYSVSKVKSHLILYRVLPAKIEVIRILHEKMDIESRLNHLATTNF